MSGLYLPSGISPARLRIEAAGHAFAKTQRTEKRARVLSSVAQRNAAWAAAVEARRRMKTAALEMMARISKRRSMLSIVDEVSRKSGVPIQVLLAPGRISAVARPRHECFWRMRNELGLSYPHIGRFFRKDHTTVLHGCWAHETRLKAKGVGNGQASRAEQENAL